MPVNDGDNGMIGLAAHAFAVKQRRAADGVSHMAARALQHFLERLAIFAEVMQQSGQGCFLFQTNGCFELTSCYTDGSKVLLDGYLSAGGIGGFSVVYLCVVIDHGVSLVYESSTVDECVAGYLRKWFLLL